MVLSIMANTTQDQEKNAAGSDSASEEVCPTEKEDIQTRGEAETDPENDIDNEVVKPTENDLKEEVKVKEDEKLGEGRENESKGDDIRKNEEREGEKIENERREGEEVGDERKECQEVEDERKECQEVEDERRECQEVEDERKECQEVEDERKECQEVEDKRRECQEVEDERREYQEVEDERRKGEVVENKRIEGKGVDEEIRVNDSKENEGRQDENREGEGVSQEEKGQENERIKEEGREERVDDEDEDNDEEFEDVEEGEDPELDEEEDEDDEEEEKAPEGKVEKPLDHDQDRRNPQYIPKGGAFYEHDNRTSLEDVENKDPQEVDKKKKVWKESKESERWVHDWYRESEQTPKSKAEIIQIYGYDIRKEEAPPRARRRRKYGRGPDRYERNWEDEQAYMIKQNGPGRRGRKKNFGREEFPPLPNPGKSDASVEKPPPKSQTWKKQEEEPPKSKSPKMNNQERQPVGGHQYGRNEPPQRNNYFYSNKKTPPPPSRKINNDDIKPFRNDKNKWKNNNFRRGKDDIPKPIKSKPPPRQGEAQTPRSIDSNKNSSGDSDISHLTEGFCQMTFHNKHSNMRDRQDSNEIPEQELDSPANRLNPKRYSKNRKSFTGFFPPEDIVEIDPEEIKQLQQEQQQKNQHVNLPQQPLNIQSVIRRYPSTYNGNPGYMATRPIITGIPNQGMSPQGLQQALSPQGIPQQALSPQVPGLQTIELQQGPLPPQPNFVSPMYIDMDPHYGPSDMMGAYPGYAPYSASQPGEMYQPSGGITYYNTECQNSNQIRPPPARRQKAVIPILPPPE